MFVWSFHALSYDLAFVFGRLWQSFQPLVGHGHVTVHFHASDGRLELEVFSQLILVLQQRVVQALSCSCFDGVSLSFGVEHRQLHAASVASARQAPHPPPSQVVRQASGTCVSHRRRTCKRGSASPSPASWRSSHVCVTYIVSYTFGVVPGGGGGAGWIPYAIPRTRAHV
eukprot:scaffold316_cov352-Pavlova_lutheri.AAC.39